MGRPLLILALAVVAVAAIVVSVRALGGDGEAEFREQALAACERHAVREAQRVYHAVAKEGLEAERKRLDAFVKDLRRVEPTGDARPAWQRVERLHADALKAVNDALGKATGSKAADRRLLERTLEANQDVIERAGAQFRKAGVPRCHLRRSETLQAAEVFRAKSDRACVRFVNSPLGPGGDDDSRAHALRTLRLIAREVGKAEPRARPPEAVAGLYRRHVLDRLDRLQRRIADARARIRDGGEPGPPFRRAVRAYLDFYDAYVEASYTLRFDECLFEQERLNRQRTAFRRNARKACGPVARAVARAIDRKSVEGLRDAHGRMERLLRRLRKMRPVPRERAQFKRALKAAKAVEDEIGSALARAGTLTLSEAQAFDRRITRKSSRARAAFGPLAILECARAF